MAGSAGNGTGSDKVDLKKLDCYRAERDEFRVLDVPDLRHLAIQGHGDPNGDEYATALAALYPLAYAVKFASKVEVGRDYVVMPLEGLWWADDMQAFTAARDKSQWDWLLLTVVPDWVDDDLVATARERVRAKDDVPARLDDVSLQTLAEGRCVQTLHVGSYDDEADVLRRMHEEFLPHHGLRMTGRHHEVYLSDPRRVAPERLRTLLRQPVAPAVTSA
jgi:hypothetical protein